MDFKRKEGRYNRIYDQLKTLLEKPGNNLSKLATVTAVLHHKMEYFFWCGFYLLDDGELIAGPYQGPVACQLLAKNNGVCWAAINEKKTIVVPDVHQFPGHIACDSRSNSEIVVPLKNSKGEIIGVLDVDSKDLNSFDQADAEGLEKILSLLKPDSIALKF
ncbi:MAG: GAF domain-containing protein [Bacteroidetes bacterium]|nr:MAG: GAF domain-containing protein [Bacteroidota bacterium]